ETFGVMTKHQQLPHVTCVATATIRQAANAKEVLALVKKETGVSIQLLSEYEEAYYGFVAVIHSTSIDEAITIDIGGGSTEVTYFRNRVLVQYHS
ncbi:exopolyphosphatase, partial [Priestia megaterium]